jgi:hypothetical protein
MSILSFFGWIENTAAGHAIRDSLWLFPVIESFHLLALAVIGGAVLIVNLRLLGLGLRRQPVAQISREVRPFMLGSLAVILVSGSLLFTSEAVKCYYNKAFWVKMTCLFLALVFTFTVQDRAIRAEEGEGGSVRAKLVAVVSVLLWTGVGVGGRWIGFS